jgi:hypothetical protein
MEYSSTFQNICYGTQCTRILWRGFARSSNLFGHEQYPSNSLDQNNLTHEGITFLLSFVKFTQYFSKFQTIWNGAQTISRVPKEGYYMFIEYFVLWTWIQHAVNVSELTWNSIVLWLSTWFAIPSSWKTLCEQNLQYPYIRGVKYFNCVVIYLFEWTRPSSMQYLHLMFSSSMSILGGSLYSFLIIVNHWGSIGVATK